MKTNQKQFTIIKKIAKHGQQAVIIVPTLLQDMLKPGTLAQITINIIEENER
jgi:predicted RNA binding protein YcfA (HicA-like mRNA interferase family)